MGKHGSREGIGIKDEQNRGKKRSIMRKGGGYRDKGRRIGRKGGGRRERKGRGRRISFFFCYTVNKPWAQLSGGFANETESERVSSGGRPSVGRGSPSRPMEPRWV